MNFITRNLVVGISKLFPDAIFYKPTSLKILALTIDDVGDDDTLKMLDVIDRFNQEISNEQEQIRATFFIISEKVTSYQILDEILTRGHEIGNHGHQDHFHGFLSPQEFRSEFNQTHEILSSNTVGGKIRWFRPGRALYNGSMLKILKEKTGYCDRFALASMLPLDTFSIINQPSFTIKYISQFIFPGSILLLHGGTVKCTANTLEVLNTLLAQLRQEEYQVVTLSRLWESE
ncbi:MAG: polysaccharide deacetylase family protein [Cyanobacteria bacterium P01_G01_bin.67]